VEAQLQPFWHQDSICLLGVLEFWSPELGPVATLWDKVPTFDFVCDPFFFDRLKKEKKRKPNATEQAFFLNSF
jgi:hypothetical protein